MNPVIGLDIAKGQSKGQAILNKGHPHGQIFDVDPVIDGFSQFLEALRSIETLSATQSKRGLSRLRHSVYVAASCSLRKTGSSRMKSFYERKRKEGKPHKVSIYCMC